MQRDEESILSNNSDYFRAQLEAQACGKEHTQHIDEYIQMCQMMIEESATLKNPIPV